MTSSHIKSVARSYTQNDVPWDLIASIFRVRICSNCMRYKAVIYDCCCFITHAVIKKLMLHGFLVMTYSSNPQLAITRKPYSRVARKPCDAAAVLFGLKLTDNIHCKFKSSQASKARLQSSKHTGTKQNLTQNGHSRSFKVTCFAVSGKAITD